MRNVTSGLALFFWMVAAAACHRTSPPSDARNAGAGLPLPGADATPRRCIVHLHGKGATGARAEILDGLVHLWPDGNGQGWGGRQWLYFPDSRYLEVRQIVADAAEGASCARVLLHGFSNGASAAAALYCRNETLGGKLVGTIIDDPVPDHAVERCTPAPGAKVRVYVTGALTGQGRAGAPCAPADWTCQGGSTIGIEAYARFLNTSPIQSSNTAHAPMPSPSEYRDWW